MNTKCRVCGTEDKDKPAIFRTEDWCCDRHRKVVRGNLRPSGIEWRTMNFELYEELKIQWSDAPDRVRKLYPEQVGPIEEVVNEKS